jgi:hypothetical protein
MCWLLIGSDHEAVSSSADVSIAKKMPTQWSAFCKALTCLREFSHQSGNGFLGIAKQHASILFVKEWIFDPGEA